MTQEEYDNSCETENCNEPTEKTVNEIRYCKEHLKTMGMKKYKVEFISTETYHIDTYAENEAEAIEKAEAKWNKEAENGTIHYFSYSGEPSIETGTVYDITNTDDPFNP